METISFEELDEWVSQQGGLLAQYAFFDDAEFFEDEGVKFHAGDLTTDTLEVSPCTVIDGNLSLRHGLTWEFERGLLVVNGNLTCQNFTFPFDTVITGDLKAHMVDLNSGCDYGLRVGGNLQAESVIERGHVIEVQGAIHAPVVKSMMNEISAAGHVYPRVPYED